MDKKRIKRDANRLEKLYKEYLDDAFGNVEYRTYKEVQAQMNAVKAVKEAVEQLRKAYEVKRINEIL